MPLDLDRMNVDTDTVLELGKTAAGFKSTSVGAVLEGVSSERDAQTGLDAIGKQADTLGLNLQEFLQYSAYVSDRKDELDSKTFVNVTKLLLSAGATAATGGMTGWGVGYLTYEAMDTLFGEKNFGVDQVAHMGSDPNEGETVGQPTGPRVYKEEDVYLALSAIKLSFDTQKILNAHLVEGNPDSIRSVMESNCHHEQFHAVAQALCGEDCNPDISPVKQITDALNAGVPPAILLVDTHHIPYVLERIEEKRMADKLYQKDESQRVIMKPEYVHPDADIRPVSQYGSVRQKRDSNKDYTTTF